MPVTLIRLDAGQLAGREPAAAWDGYCARHPKATPYHLSAWGRAVTAALGHEPHYLCTQDAGTITGVLPLFLRRSVLFGTNLVSVPAANVGGPLADDDATVLRLVEGAIALARELEVDFLELRDVPPDSPAAAVLRRDEGRYVTAVVDLRDGEAAAWSRLSRGIRRRVRRARDAGVVVEIERDLAAFYAVYTKTMKRLGSPPFAARFFEELASGFGDTLQVGVARLDSRAAAVDLLLSYNGVRYSVFAGSVAELWDVYPNQVLLWDEMRDALARGLTTFDLGRSLAASGSLEFKGAWGGRILPLTYGYLLHRTPRLPRRTPDMPVYRALGRIWSLLPDRVVTAIGPRVVRHLF
jgi:FemAB-related protein (PEP-CTERM system-associated)